QCLAAANPAHFQNGSADGHVGLRKANALFDCAGRMANLEAKVPQNIKDKFDRLVHIRRILWRKQEKKVDIGTWRQGITTITTNTRDRYVTGILGIDIWQPQVIKQFDQAVLQPGNTTGAIQATAIDVQQLTGLFTSLIARLAKDRQ